MNLREVEDILVLALEAPSAEACYSHLLSIYLAMSPAQRGVLFMHAAYRLSCVEDAASLPSIMGQGEPFEGEEPTATPQLDRILAAFGLKRGGKP